MHRKNTTHDSGFTMVELLIAMVISTIISAAIFSAYRVQQRIYTAQTEVVDLQQNIRAALGYLKMEIREAGFDPENTGNFGIVTAGKGAIEFTKDINADGVVDSLETIEYGFEDSTDDALPRDGVPDGGKPVSLGRRVNGAGGGNWEPIAEGVERIEFRYLDDNDNVTATAGDIRTVEVSMLVRAGAADDSFNQNQSFSTPAGTTWGPYTDHFRRRFASTRIRTRNIGL